MYPALIGLGFIDIAEKKAKRRMELLYIYIISDISPRKRFT
jgi:hypothetical protein